MAVKLEVDLSGPFFTRNPGLTLRGNIARMMEGIASEGERLVRQDLARGESARATIRRLGDRVSGHAIGRVTSLSGKHWLATAVLSVNNRGYSRAQGISLMAAASSLESRQHSFRRVAQAIRRSRVILNANLTAGLE